MRTSHSRWLSTVLIGAPAVAIVAEASLALIYGWPRTPAEALTAVSVVAVLLAASAVIVALAVCLSRQAGLDGAVFVDHTEEDSYIPDPPVILSYPRRFSGPHARWKTTSA